MNSPRPLAMTPPACTSKAAFAPYSRRGSPPSSAPDLPFCTSFRNATCCDATHAALARSQAHALVQGGSSDACFAAWTQLSCAVCAPGFGVAVGAPVCASLCEVLLTSCGNDFFATDTLGNLAPCRERDAVCVRLNEAAPDSAGACQLAGFDVATPPEPCYAGRMPVNTLAVTPRSRSATGRRAPSSFATWLRHPPLNSTAALCFALLLAAALLRYKPWRSRTSRSAESARERILAAAEKRRAASLKPA